MTDKLSTEKQNEILITWLLHHAGYDFERDKHRALEKVNQHLVRGEVDSLPHLRIINRNIDQEELGGSKVNQLDPHQHLKMINERVNGRHAAP